MRIVVVSDLHGRSDFIPSIAGELRSADAVVVAGDLTESGSPEELAAVVKEFVAFGHPVLAVLGNSDHPSYGPVLLDLGACLECEGTVLDGGLAAVGCGGGLAVDGTTPYERPEDDLVDTLESAWDRLKADSLVDDGGGAADVESVLVVCHTPPFGCAADCPRPGEHLGSRMVRGFIERRRPLVFVCGHVHEAAAVDRIGPTTVVNPGAFADGHFAVLTLEKTGELWSLEAELRSFL